MITVEKIKIYEKYSGDDDHLARVGSDYQKKLFENNEWCLISNYFQDIHLISNRISAQSYVMKTLEKLREDCDSEALNLLTERIPFYKYFQEIALILENIKRRINPNTDVIWAGYNNPNEFLDVLRKDIEAIRNCDFEILEKISIYFAPTGKYQEISISNSWGKEFLELADNFDDTYVQLRKIKNCT